MKLCVLFLFFHDPVDVVNLISVSSVFSKTSSNIWKFTAHALLKPGLENFKHYFPSVWDECNCEVVWAFFGIAFLWDWNENWPLVTINSSLYLDISRNTSVRLYWLLKRWNTFLSVASPQPWDFLGGSVVQNHLQSRRGQSAPSPILDVEKEMATHSSILA